MKKRVLKKKLKVGFDINNPLVNSEDLKNHYGVLVELFIIKIKYYYYSIRSIIFGQYQ